MSSSGSTRALRVQINAEAQDAPAVPGLCQEPGDLLASHVDSVRSLDPATKQPVEDQDIDRCDREDRQERFRLLGAWEDPGQVETSDLGQPLAAVAPTPRGLAPGDNDRRSPACHQLVRKIHRRDNLLIGPYLPPVESVNDGRLGTSPLHYGTKIQPRQ